MPVLVQWVGYIITLCGFLGAFLKIWKRLKKIGEGQQCQLRSDITAIYYRHCDEKDPTLREYERKNLDLLNGAYKALDGNNYIDDLYEVMRHWKVMK